MAVDMVSDQKLGRGGGEKCGVKQGCGTSFMVVTSKCDDGAMILFKE